MRRLAGRIDNRTFVRERNRVADSWRAWYDATRHRDRSRSEPRPRRTTTIRCDAPPRAAVERETDLYARILKGASRSPTICSTASVSSRWDWGGGRSTPQRCGELRSVLASDPRLRVLVTHGASDLVTPYFETQLILDQLPAFASPDRLKLSVYGGAPCIIRAMPRAARCAEDAKNSIAPLSRSRAAQAWTHKHRNVRFGVKRHDPRMPLCRLLTQSRHMTG